MCHDVKLNNLSIFYFFFPTDAMYRNTLKEDGNEL